MPPCTYEFIGCQVAALKAPSVCEGWKPVRGRCASDGGSMRSTTARPRSAGTRPSQLCDRLQSMRLQTSREPRQRSTWQHRHLELTSVPDSHGVIGRHGSDPRPDSGPRSWTSRPGKGNMDKVDEPQDRNRDRRRQHQRLCRPGLVDAAEMQPKSQLAAEIARAIRARRLTQQGSAKLLGVDQSRMSRITRGRYRGVSEAKLLDRKSVV